MRFSVQVEVRLRAGVADPQGATIERSLPHLGFEGVGGVRVGKLIRFEIDAADRAVAQREVDDLCARFLTNPVIEDSSVTLSVVDGSPGLMATRVGVVQFPGSNCEQDVVEAVQSLGGRGEILWHGDRDLRGVDAVVVPGGFAHGDYLRPGAIARFSPVMQAVAEHAMAGGPVVGICNGFQILTEAGLLPGALQKNRGLKFLCTTVSVRVETVRSVLTSAATPGQELRVPINHFEGNYTCDDDTLAMLQAEDRIVLRYVENPNGSVDSIAGVTNEGRNVVGLMPHPERASSDLLGSVDGLPLLRSLLQSAPTPA